MTIKVVVISPYPTVRAGLRALLGESDAIEVVGAAMEAPESPVTWTPPPDVVLIDGTTGPGMLDAIERIAPELPIVVVGSEPVRGNNRWRAAPRGYLAHDANAQEIAAAVRAVAAGLSVAEPAFLRAEAIAGVPALGDGGRAVEPLTSRELEVLQLVAAGLPNKSIALKLRISEHTAKFHVSSVLAKFGAGSRTEAVTAAARQGLLLL